jgi:inorganic pyrophosphatase
MENSFNPWHHVSPGNKLPEFVNGIIEIPKGTRAKYELDKESGLLKLDRVLYSSVYYPANYGFIPQSFCDDHDPLDILILSQIDVVPMCIVEAKVIGVMRMLDNGEADDKIIAVAAGDPSVSHIQDISELPAHFISEMRSFFEDYKKTGE